MKLSASKIQLVRKGSVPSFSESHNLGFVLDDHRSSKSQLIRFNVGGTIYQTYASTLSRFPDSLLADSNRRAEFYNAAADEYFFDRDRLAFDSILECYRSGKIIRSTLTPIHLFVRELLFYDLGDDFIVDFLRAEELYEDSVPVPINPVHKFCYELFEKPESSLAAKAVAMLDILLTFLAITSMCVHSLPIFQPRVVTENGTIVSHTALYSINEFSNPFFCIDLVCNNWFIMDILIRFTVSPQKRTFFFKFMNVIDVLSIVPFFLDLIVSYVTNQAENASAIAFLLAFRILRLFRVFRMFKMYGMSDGISVLANTISTAGRELGTMVLFFLTGMIFFGATIFYAERGNGYSEYTSIPASFWWAVITWTTIGYGDVYPKSPSGKVVGCICAVSGVICLGLMLPPLVRRFEHYFYRAQTMQDLATVFVEHRETRKTKAIKDAKDYTELHSQFSAL